MAKKLRQPTGKQQPQVRAQPDAAVEQDHQSAKQQKCDNPAEAMKQAISTHDHSQDADRHNKTRHVQSEK